MLRQVRTFCAATVFDGGRMRDTVFVGMPKIAELGTLNRASLPIANKDTFLYAASVLDLRKEMEPRLANPGPRVAEWCAKVHHVPFPPMESPPRNGRRPSAPKSESSAPGGQIHNGRHSSPRWG